MNITLDTAKEIGGKLGIDFKDFSSVQFKNGIGIELEHTGTIKRYMRPGADELLIAGSIALDHLKEAPDYYKKLKKVEGG